MTPRKKRAKSILSHSFSEKIINENEKNPLRFFGPMVSLGMIKNGTYKKQEALDLLAGLGHFVSQNNKRTIWRKNGVQVTASYWDIATANYWTIKVKKIA